MPLSFLHYSDLLHLYSHLRNNKVIVRNYIFWVLKHHLSCKYYVTLYLDFLPSLLVKLKLQRILSGEFACHVATCCLFYYRHCHDVTRTTLFQWYVLVNEMASPTVQVGIEFIKALTSNNKFVSCILATPYTIIVVYKIL